MALEVGQIVEGKVSGITGFGAFIDLPDGETGLVHISEVARNYVKDIKKYFYPTGMVNTKDTIYLADAYASIMYNNLAIETTSELLNSTQASESDYKNYLVALGFYKSNNLNPALKYINNAILQNDVNVNYKILKAKKIAFQFKFNKQFLVKPKIF